MSEHHDAVLFEIRQTVTETVNRSLRIAGPIDCDVASLHFGLGLVVCRGFLEKEMNKLWELPPPGKFPKRMKNISDKPVVRAIDFWQYKFDPKNDWYGWEELTNFFRMADGFYETGKTLNGKTKKVQAFGKQLQAGAVKNHKKKPIAPYYDLDDEGKLKLQSEALNRFTALSGELVRLAEKFLRRKKKAK